MLFVMFSVYEFACVRGYMCAHKAENRTKLVQFLQTRKEYVFKHTKK